MKRWQLIGLALALAVVIAGKHAYRTATADELRFLLAPTARLVSLTTGTHFAYEAGAGWLDRDVTFLIAPVCAGGNFALAAFLALALGGLPGIISAGAVARRLATAAAAAYAATLVVNTVRIAIAIEMHRGAIDLGDVDRAEAHRIEGIIVYLGGLCALYALARSVEARRARHALAT
jgi:exosortase K